MGRLDVITSKIQPAKVFADVGCDHGYCAKYALDHGLCELAYITDISAGSLKKAKTLLNEAILAGKCVPVVCDGMDGLGEVDFVLIAGMGGEEIVKILSRRELPPKFLLQPMKNAEKVRRHLIGRGARIVEDFTFEDGNFYDLISGEREGQDEYSEFEFRYGRDNLSHPTPAFLHRLAHDANNFRHALEAPDLQRERRDEVRRKLYDIEVILDAVKGDI